jgi:mannan endo-1,4-beta-mannosidase
MLPVTSMILILAPLLQAPPAAVPAQGFNDFVTRQGDRLMEGDKEFRFVSFNVPNLHYIEDNLPFEERNPWRIPDEFEIRDALTSVKQAGGRVVRTYTLSVRKTDDDASIPRYVLGPGQFNEEAMRALDMVMKVAHETGVRVIIPFVDQWSWFGGIAEYAAFRGKKAAAFWTDPQLIDDFKLTINYLLNRTNVCTGVKYREDKALLAWETGNELLNPYSWSREIAAYIKSLDSSHLVLDGFHAGSKGLKEEPLSDPNIDLVSTHHYPASNSKGEEIAGAIARNRQMTCGRKAYLVGEFGFIPTEQVEKVLDTVIESGTAGALVWSLRFHNRDGGFYWHSEPLGAGLYKAYHWPGFSSGDDYQETALLSLMREAAYRIQGTAPPEIALPAAPVLLPVRSAFAISWQGSAGAASYEVERSKGAAGPWEVVGTNVSDADVQYRPLFSDRYVLPGEAWFYRVRARNAAGSSPPSNVAGPVQVESLVLVDEMRDLSNVFAASRELAVESIKARQAKEDVCRIIGSAGSEIVYRTIRPMQTARVCAFYPRDVVDFEFQASNEGTSWTPVPAARTDFYSGTGDYGYWKPSLYEVRAFPAGTLFFRIVFKTEAQVGRVEIEHGGGQSR